METSRLFLEPETAPPRGHGNTETNKPAEPAAQEADAELDRLLGVDSRTKSTAGIDFYLRQYKKSLN